MSPRRLAALIGACALAALTATAPAAAAPAAAALTATAPGPPLAPEYWFDTWRVPQLWDSGARGQDVVIAEIDTGVNADLPELSGRILPGHDFGTGGDGRIDREVNAFGHGTAMASIMVGAKGILDITGTAPDAKVLPIAVPLSGTEAAKGNDHLSQAIKWAADHGAKIISMSLGGARDPKTDTTACPEAEQRAVYYAMSKGSVLLAASGNNGQTTSAVEEPGVCLGVISVGAVDRDGTVAPFSSRHPYLTLTAPGVDIASLSRVPGSAYSGDGTSQATALASAAMALVWSKYPQLTGRQLVARVLATLDRRSQTRDPAYGYGTINPYRAITRDVPLDAPNPVYDAAQPFYERWQASAKRAAAPPPAAAPSKEVGSYEVGRAPRLFAPRVLQGFAVAGVGLLGVLALTLMVWISRRRPVVVREDVPALPEVPVVPDPTGLVWHDIINPEAPAEQHRLQHESGRLRHHSDEPA